MRLILASTSPRRADLLRESGIPFRVEKPGVEEWVAADTLVVCQSRILGKPADEKMAEEMLGWLSGRTHEVITATVLILPGGKKTREAVVRTRVKFRILGIEEVRSYLRDVEVLDKAGAYALQDGGDRIVEQVEGSRSNVIGLPMETVLPWCEELVVGEPLA